VRRLKGPPRHLMHQRTTRVRFWLCTLGVSLALLAHLSGQGRPPSDDDVMYIMPVYEQFYEASVDELKAEIAKLRERIGPEGPTVRFGFTTYVPVVMDDWSVKLDDPVAIRAALQTTIDRLDRNLARAQAAGVRVCMSFPTALRSRYDPVQKAAEEADGRNTQWFGGRDRALDNTLSSGWMTLSRYARRYEAVQEAYLRELGKIIANRMRQYPDTFVAAAGDGEVELSYEKSPIANPLYTSETMLLADYSPFAIAEFRDWLIGAGLYARGQVYEHEAYDGAVRYAGGKLGQFNQDFGTTFSSFQLRYFDWSLDAEAASAIPASEYNAPTFNRHPSSNPYGFDAPRIRDLSSRWWQMWMTCPRVMVWRHNLDFAKWITTSADTGPGSGNTGATVPNSRWYSYQIPADRLYGLTPTDPANVRYETSASAWWTADISPYGRVGTTAFNLYYGPPPGPGPACASTNAKVNYFCRTLANLATQIAQRHLKCGLLEWHPGVGDQSLFPQGSDIYGEEMKLIERYRPSLIAPYALYTVDPKDPTKFDEEKPFYDSGFETALKGLVARLRKK